MYKILPETENRTLEEIELHFSNNSRKLTDRNIAKADPMSSKMANGDIEAMGQKSQNPISVVSELTENVRNEVIHRNGTNVQNGCDNKGFSMDTMDR